MKNVMLGIAAALCVFATASSHALINPDNIAKPLNSRDWFGLLTAEQHPIAKCRVVDFQPVVKRLAVSQVKSEQLAQLTKQLHSDIETLIRKEGWHGMLNTRTQFLGGAGQIVDGSVNFLELSGVLVLEGTAVKVKCK